MSRPRTALRALVAALAGVLLLTGCDLDVYKLPLPGGTDVGDDAITVQADFRDVLDHARSAAREEGLVLGAPVPPSLTTPQP